MSACSSSSTDFQNQQEDQHSSRNPLNLLFGDDPDALTYLSFDITRKDLEKELQKYKQLYPFCDSYRSLANPYSGLKIKNQTEYYSYLREYAYYVLCEQQASKNLLQHAHELKHLYELQLHDQTVRHNREKHVVEFRLKEANKKLSLTQDDLKETKEKLEHVRQQSIKAENKSFRRSAILIFLLIASIVAIFVVSNKSYDYAYSDGYNEAKSAAYSEGYKDGEEVAFSEGYSEGYSDGYKRKTTSSGASNSGSSHTGTGSSRDNAIANGYIGNKKTKKYHRSTCSYLPDRSNQIVFGYESEATSAGYKPCSHCDP